jgi:dCMP deaminase
MLWKPNDKTIRNNLAAAYNFANRRSDDPRTKNGAVIYTENSIACGANRIPFGVAKSKDRLTQATKLDWLVHAEVDAICQAASIGMPLMGQTLYCPWACCKDCAKAIIQSGIARVVTHRQIMDKTPLEWQYSIRIGYTMLKEAGVEYVCWSGKIGGITNLFRGEIWEP